MDKKEERLNHILRITTGILSQEGADELSMRKIAKAANLSLSNLQYYYKDKNELLIATAQYYFQSCAQEVTQTLNLLKAETTFSIEKFLEKVLDLLLVKGKDSEQSVMFREIWALSSRNEQLEKAVETYYKNYCIWMIDLIASFSKQPHELVSLLVPYVEGYAIMGSVLPLNKEAVIKLLIKVILYTEE